MKARSLTAVGSPSQRRLICRTCGFRPLAVWMIIGGSGDGRDHGDDDDAFFHDCRPWHNGVGAYHGDASFRGSYGGGERSFGIPVAVPEDSKLPAEEASANKRMSAAGAVVPHKPAPHEPGRGQGAVVRG